MLASDNGHVLFRYTKRANKQNVREPLGGYQGYLQADAATIFDFLYLDQTCVEVGCWAHCRRRYFDALTTDSERANTALGLIAQLYLIDRESIDIPLEVRTRERAARAGPVLDALLAWVDAQALEVLPESPIGKAVTYTRNQRVALSRFLGDGRLRLDNNRSERELRREAVGRKNWLFVGSDEGAKWNATFVSLIASCQQHKLEPWAYLSETSSASCPTGSRRASSSSRPSSGARHCNSPTLSSSSPPTGSAPSRSRSPRTPSSLRRRQADGDHAVHRTATLGPLRVSNEACARTVCTEGRSFASSTPVE